jgi:hypothetical protein
MQLHYSPRRHAHNHPNRQTSQLSPLNRGSYTFVGDGDTARILQETVKTSSPTDLLLSVTAESSILARLVTMGMIRPNAEGTIRVYITIDGQIVSPSGGPTGPGQQRRGDTAPVVFANQVYNRTTSGFTADPQATMDDYTRTKHASGFNWAVLNVGSGTHQIEVFATYSQTTTANGTTQGVIGNRSLVVQAVKCQVNEILVDTTQNQVPPLPVPLN